MEKLKAPLRDFYFIIQIPKREKRTSCDVSQVLIRSDQSALYTTAAKCKLFAKALLGQGAFHCRFVRNRKNERKEKTWRNMRSRLARNLRVFNKYVCTPICAFLFICVSCMACSLSLLEKPFTHLSFICFNSASWLVPEVRMEIVSNHKCTRSLFLAIFLLFCWGNNHKGRQKQTIQQKKNRSGKWMR